MNIYLKPPLEQFALHFTLKFQKKKGGGGGGVHKILAPT